MVIELIFFEKVTVTLSAEVVTSTVAPNKSAISGHPVVTIIIIVTTIERKIRIIGFFIRTPFRHSNFLSKRQMYNNI